MLLVAVRLRRPDRDLPIKQELYAGIFKGFLEHDPS